MSERGNRSIRAAAKTLWPGVIVWGLVASCCILPIAWVTLQLVTNRTALVEMRLDSFRVNLIARTIGYNVCVAIVATALSIPAAIVLGRGRGVLARLLWLALPISLLMPSLTFAYGWKQCLRLLDIDPPVAGLVDVARCVWSLATWLWPVPAVVIGMSLRRMDMNVQQQAQLDGALWRVTLRQLIAPAIASTAIVAALAMQEFAVYEPTGISVIATETRMVFETGAFSSPDNPITQNFSSSTDAPAPSSGISAEGPTNTREPSNVLPSVPTRPNMRASEDSPPPDQRARAAAAVATSLPMLAVIAVLSIIAAIGVRRLGSSEAIDVGTWPRSLDASALSIVASWAIVALALAVPIIALVLSHKRPFRFKFVWGEFGPEVIGTLTVAAITGAVMLVLAMAAAVRRNRAASVIALLSFLLGGQIVAIALIRLYNHPQSVWLYQSALPVVMAYVARFGWIVLFAAAATWSPQWRTVRDLAAVDGASARATARYVIWPLAWPLLGASALFVATLSLSEVPATVLLAPQQPQVLVPLLMTWVHALRSDPMIEASLVTAAMVVVIGAIAVMLAAIGARRNSQLTIHTSQKSSKPSNFKFQTSSFVAVCLLCFAIGGCHSKDKPDEIWLEAGAAPGQVVYPRGICYSPADDTFFIVDRSAHIQHLDRNGKFLNDWHTPAAQQGKPVGLSVGPDGNLYVPDTHYHRVLIYSPQGKPLHEWGTRGTGPGQFIYPTDVAFDAKGNVFISEYGDNDRVQVFDRDGKYLYQFGKFGDGPGEFSRPQSMLIDGDFVYITDSCNHRLSVFKTDGTFVRNMGEVGTGPGQFRFPYGLDMDKDGDLIVCEFGNNRLQKIDKKTGKSKGVWGGAGREPGQLAYPWGVAVDKRDRIIAVDAGNNRVQVFGF